MIRFLKIQENSGLANNDVDQMQTVSVFARWPNSRRRSDIAVEESSRHRNTEAIKSRDSATDSTCTT
jgi:hypothetical protein